MRAELATELELLRERGQRGLWAATGQVGDAVSALGRRLGSEMAAAGVHNSSAVAGALANASASAQSGLLNYAQGLRESELAQASAGRRWLAGQELGVAASDLESARAEQAAALASFASLLGTLGQLSKKGSPPSGGGTRAVQSVVQQNVRPAVPVFNLQGQFGGNGMYGGALPPLQGRIRLGTPSLF
jgi:hypothetical protein